MSASSRVGIVASMAAELESFVRDAGLKQLTRGRLNLFASDRFVAAYAGMGKAPALSACAAVWEQGEIARMVSAGWCGALAPDIPAPSVQQVSTVIDVSTGESFSAANEGRVLVTVDRVVGVAEKRELRLESGAELVDMEAAHVARFAQERGIEFAALKAVSDAHDAVLPDLQAFSTSEGRFETGRFVAWLAVRPRWWGPMALMGKNAKASARQLGVQLQRLG